MKEILIASNNKGKIEEIKKIFDNYKLLTLKDVNCCVDVIEDGKTFEENSVKKATEIAKVTGKPTISDDSGLCIEALDNWPGVHTARFLNSEGDVRIKNEEIINRMKSISNRNAKFICVISYCDNDKVITTKGEICGKIAFSCRGENGFGFDEIFEIDNGKTLAELSKEEKNNLSSRKIALEKLKELIK